MAAAISATLVFAARRRPLVCSLSSSSSKPNTRKLVLYSKPGCCLCDGLKEKLNAAFSLSSGSDSLNDVTLQVSLIQSRNSDSKFFEYIFEWN